MHKHTSEVALGAEVYPEKPQKKSKAVSDSNDPVPLDTSGLLDEITMEEIRRIMSEALDKSSDKYYGLRPKYSKKNINQRLAGLEHEARQPLLTAEVNVETDKKTRKRTEGATVTDRTKHNGDSSSARRVDAAPTNLTNFGKIVEPSLAHEKCVSDAMVSKGAEAQKWHLPPVEVRMLPSAAGGLLPAGTASTATKTIFHQPPLWKFFPAKEINFRTTTSIQHATYSIVWKMKVLETKPRKTLVFDPDGCRSSTCLPVSGRVVRVSL